MRKKILGLARWSNGSLTVEYLESQPMEKVINLLNDANEFYVSEKAEIDKITRK